MKQIAHRLTLVATLILCALSLAAQTDVNWSAKINMTSGTKGNIVVSAQVNPGFHFYAFPPEGGFNALEMKVAPQAGLTVGAPKPSVAPESHWDENQEENLSSWARNVNFTIPIEITDAKNHSIEVTVRYQACNSTMCFAPNKKSFTLNALYDASKDPKAAAAQSAPETPQPEAPVVAAQPDTTVAVADTAAVDTAAIASPVTVDSTLTGGQPQWWEPVDAHHESAGESGWMIFVIGLLGGLAAVLTPCVWPLIPMTLSFFLKKTKGAGAKGFHFNRDALIYGLSIVVIYVVLGLAITMIFGAGKLNDLSTSALFNLIFFAILVVFAISFLGAFDIKLPAKWSNSIDNKAETTSGLVSIFFMAFTLVLVSFSCTGPIIGTLLVEAASQGNILGPALGMGGFSLGLALPFTLFAMFPSMLKEMPKSGGWLNSVKVVLGFIELILSLKFLSVADMAYGWRILDREVFIAIWVVLFVLLGLYLLGKLTFSHDSKVEKIGAGRFMLALLPLSFAVYLLPGLWGAPLKATSAFVPPLTTQDFNLYTHDKEYKQFDDYNEGMRYAKEHGLPVMIDFSGYGCVNCRNMEVAVLDTDQVRDMIAENFVVIKLMVDDKKELPAPIEVVDDNGQTIKLETYGEKWTYLQSHKFGASSQPYYMVLDNEGRSMNEPMAFDNSIPNFMGWLERGLEEYNNSGK